MREWCDADAWYRLHRPPAAAFPAPIPAHPIWPPAAARSAPSPWPSLGGRSARLPLDRGEGVVPAPDLLDDAVRVGRPDKRPRALVVFVDEAVDRLLQGDQRREAAPPQAALGELGEEGLDRVEPGARGWGEVEGPARVAVQPGPDLGMLMGGADRLRRVRVEDGVHPLAGRRGRLDRVEKAEKRLVAMPLHAAAGHRAVEPVEGGEEGRGPVPDIIVGHGRELARLYRPTWLGPVASLDLALLVDRPHDRVRRRAHVEPDDVAQLGDELGIARQLEGPDPVRNQPVRLPDPLHRAEADADPLGHG